MSSGMVCHLPFRVYDRSFPNLHDAIARLKADNTSGICEFNVSPLITVVVNIVCDLGEQDAFGPQYPIGFTEKRRERVRKSVAVLFRGSKNQAKPRIEIL